MRAEAIARHVAEKLDLVGVLAVEMFVTQSGELLVNEIAPRPHNSGPLDDRCLHHQPVRAAGARALRPAARLRRASLRCGDEEPDGRRCREMARERSTDPPAKLHLYGKTEIQPGRKMGHVTRLIPHR